MEDYWPIILGILFWLFSSLFGDKNKKAEKEAKQKELMEKARQQRQAAKGEVKRQFQEIAARQSETEGSIPNSLKALIAEAERRIQEGISEAEQPKATSPVTPAKPSERQQIRELVNMPDADFESFDATPTADQRSNPFEFRSQTEKVTERIDYDTQTRSFGFNEPIKETVDQQYHTSGFQNFHAAHGFTHPGGKSRIVEAATVDEEHSEYEGVFNNTDDVRRIMVLKEILDKPIALRR